VPAAVCHLGLCRRCPGGGRSLGGKNRIIVGETSGERRRKASAPGADIYIHTYIYYTYMYTSTYMCVYMCVCVCVFAYTYIYTCMYVSIFI